jgi:hypothetical protein
MQQVIGSLEIYRTVVEIPPSKGHLKGQRYGKVM